MRVICDKDRRLCAVEETENGPECRFAKEIAEDEGIVLSRKMNLSCQHRCIEWQGAVK